MPFPAIAGAALGTTGGLGLAGGVAGAAAPATAGAITAGSVVPVAAVATPAMAGTSTNALAATAAGGQSPAAWGSPATFSQPQPGMGPPPRPNMSQATSGGGFGSGAMFERGMGLLAGPMGGVIGAVGTAVAAKGDKYRKYNQGEIAKLKRTKGQGLTGDEARLLERNMMAPVQSQAAAQQAYQQRLATAMGNTSAANQAQFRDSQLQQLSGAQQAAGQQIAAANIAARKQKQAEYEARLASEQEYKRALTQSMFGALASGLQISGQNAATMSAPQQQVVYTGYDPNYYTRGS